MVKETEYYDTLEVTPTASELEIKKAYRKLAIKLHPDKNLDDPTAPAKFQAISEAYQVLSNEELRKQYDKYGKERAVPDSGFEDPSEFFSMIFGGDAFEDWIGELSLMKDLTRTMEITMKEMEEEEAASEEEAKNKDSEIKSGSSSPGVSGEHKPTEHKPTTSDGLHAPVPASPTASRSSTPRPKGVPTRAMLMDKSEEDRMAAEGLTEEEKELKRKDRKKAGMTKKQREAFAALQAEQRETRNKRVEMLTKKLIDRISVWTETDQGEDTTRSFKEKTICEVENLKMESFGIEILHAIGHTYISKGASFIKSQKFLGISGFFSRLKDKGNIVKDTWGTISTAIDAQMTMEEMAKLEEKGGDDWTDEKKAEYERKVTGKILAAAWRGSKSEIQSVLRDVCDRVLNDKNVKLEKRVERAHALIMIGTIFKAAERDPDEEFPEGVFEQLVADAAKKENDKKDKKGKAKEAEAKKNAPTKGSPSKPKNASSEEASEDANMPQRT
ncbi:DnaJ-domain-containing protein [Morchella conica CCBAS932]|uniref:DnaJ-domain-containing protein n=1 Tax=Morchella conica CCBAS932 TaxID=1392247 RepID=A0A3N4KPP5_9PEZI|nr:DnaJ-domain-containing protein [Morchella conica CCBAS932]